MSNLQDIEAAAAAWDARLRAGTGDRDRDREAFLAWLAESPDHQMIHDRLQGGLLALRAQADVPELSALREEAHNRTRSLGRRRMITGLSAMAASLLLVFGLALPTERGAEVSAMVHGATIYRTALNERTRVILADGSEVTLDSDTRIAANFKGQNREITLLAGRALFRVEKDPSRPFIVTAGDRTVTALGTVFDVALDQGNLSVTLAEGRVAVQSTRAAPGPARIMKPNEQLVSATGRPSVIVQTVDTDRVLGWVDGQIYFDNQTVTAAVHEMNQYSRLKIVIDPAVADMRINGMFRAGNQNGFAAALKATLPVDVRTNDRGQILVLKHAVEPTAETYETGNGIVE